MNRDVFLSILALDAYNRGYDAGLAGSNAVPAAIGNAIVDDDKGDAAAIAESFYAVAYEMSGEIIISYRGTDRAFSLFSPFSPADLDDWGGGFGGETGQAMLAAAFYRNVTEDNVYGTQVTLTGHRKSAISVV
jgi:hypothetical protein